MNLQRESRNRRLMLLPKDAINVQLSIELLGIFSSNKCEMVWKDPINQWNKGKKDILTYGVWPSNAWCQEMKALPK